MLEPFLRPRAGKSLHAIGIALAAGATFTNAGVSTPYGHVPALVLMPLLAITLAARFAGIHAGEGRGLKEMPWAYRAASWASFGLVLLLVGAFATRFGALAFLGVCALDAAGALVRRRPPEEGEGWKWPRVRVKRWPVVAAAYAALAGLVHVVWARNVPYGPLVDWTLLVLGFAAVLRLVAAGPVAEEPEARPPPAHRVHRRVARARPDPAAGEWDAASAAFLADGDAGPLLDVVRRTARFAGWSDASTRDVEHHVRAALARAGTTREADLTAAVTALESAMTTNDTVRITR